MMKVGVVGATGYTGEELVRLLSRHAKVKLTYTASGEGRPVKTQELFPYLKGSVDLPCEAFDIERATSAADVLFLALPHTESMKSAPLFVSRGKKVIDVSADYRLKDPKVYQKYYGVPHIDPANITKAVYGLPELNRAAIKTASLIANPGCYPTGAALGLLPFVKGGIEWTGTCVIDAKSGVTGAGRKAASSLLFSEVNENFKAYKVLTHQHEAEIAQTLGGGALKNTSFVFVTHLLPVDRGILSTIYVNLPKKMPAEALWKVFSDFYRNEPFVNVLGLGRFPEIKHVHKTNQCHIGVAAREDGMAVIVTAIDNLGKGAAGQAVQNMNLMCGFPETEGIV